MCAGCGRSGKVFRNATLKLTMLAFIAHSLFGCCLHTVFAEHPCSHQLPVHAPCASSAVSLAVSNQAVAVSDQARLERVASPTVCCHHIKPSKIENRRAVSTLCDVVPSWDDHDGEPCESEHHCHGVRCRFLASNATSTSAKIHSAATSIWAVAGKEFASQMNNQAFARPVPLHHVSSSRCLCIQTQSWQI